MTASEEIVCLTDNEDDCILESVTYNSKHEYIKTSYDSIFKENPLFVKVIEKCFDLESSQGMSMVINGTLIRFYKEADENYKMSTEFETILKKTLTVLENDPDYRFSHIKNLCEILRCKKFKKRVQLISLGKNITGNKVSNFSLKRKSSMQKKSKIQKTDIIDVDKIEDIPIINLDNDLEHLDNTQNDVMMSSEICTVVDEKENYSTKENNGYLEPSADKLLVPQKILELPTVDLNKVQEIEMQIKKYKEMISKLDEQEVTVDTDNSPYLESERLKGKIVALYKELCMLTGDTECKRREVRLNVIEGHPPGPVQNLERFLNDNIGSDGNPPFPDFGDVVECVVTANKNDNLGWNKHQIMNEARALFTHCGRALQKRRQKRDWRYILSRVKAEQFDDDPADNDPVLYARLEANKRAALKKEAELLERYAMMQYLPPQRNVAKNGKIKLQLAAVSHMTTSDNNSEGSADESAQILINKNKVAPDNEELLNNNKVNSEVDTPKDPVSNISNVIEPDIPIHDPNPTSNKIKISSMKLATCEEINNIAGTIISDVNIKVENYTVSPMKSPSCEKINNIAGTITSDVDITVESDNVVSPMKSPICEKINNTAGTITSDADIKVESDMVKVKTEPTEDVMKLLDALGDDYTVSVVDLNDPFFVIEISDSSDEE